MKSKRFYHLVVTIITASLLAGCQKKFLAGTGLELVARYGSYKLYVGNNKTNPVRGFALLNGNECVVWCDASDKASYEMTFFHEGINVMDSTYAYDGRLIKESFSYYDAGKGVPKITYIDTNGDGILDIFLNYTDNTKSVRSNGCWVLLRPIKVESAPKPSP